MFLRQLDMKQLQIINCILFQENSDNNDLLRLFLALFFSYRAEAQWASQDHGLNQSDRDRRKSRQMERRQWGREKSEIIHGCTKRDRWRRSGFVVGEVCEAAVTERMKNGADQLLAAMFPRERRLGISSAVTLNASPPPSLERVCMCGGESEINWMTLTCGTMRLICFLMLWCLCAT